MLSRDAIADHAKADPAFDGHDPMDVAYRVLAFDPGERTGYVRVTVTHDYAPTTGDGFFIEDQGVLTVSEVFKELKVLVAKTDVVSYETWRLYSQYAEAFIGNDMQPSQVVGMIRYEAWQQQKKINSEGADIKKSALKTMPRWLLDHIEKSSEQHDRDAVMHAWFYAIKRYHREQKK